MWLGLSVSWYTQEAELNDQEKKENKSIEHLNMNIHKSYLMKFH